MVDTTNSTNKILVQEHLCEICGRRAETAMVDFKGMLRWCCIKTDHVLQLYYKMKGENEKK